VCPLIPVLDVPLRFFDGTEPPRPSDSYTPFGRIYWELKFYSADAGFPHLRMENELNRNYAQLSFEALKKFKEILST